MAHWIAELGEFQGGFRIYKNDEEQTPCYYDPIFTYMRICASWQADFKTEPIEIGRLTYATADGIDVIGSQVIEEAQFDIIVEFQYDREPRRFENLYTDEDIFHVGDKLTICRSNALPGIGLYEVAGMERPCLSWTGEINTVTMSPILHEALFEENVCPLYGITSQPTQFKVRMIEEGE